MRTITDRSLSVSMRCYRGLLRAYPQSFLMEFEDLLCQAFGDLAHRAVRTKGIWGLFVLWIRTVSDLISSAYNQRFQPDSDWRFRLRWIAGCTAGAVFGVAFMFIVMMAVNRIQVWMGISLSLQRPRSIESFNTLVLQLTASFGLGVGWFQALAIGWKRPRSAAWVLATMIGAASTSGVLLLAPVIDRYLQVTIHPLRLLVNEHRILYNGGMALLCLSLMGSLQAFVLARRNVRGFGWIPISAIAVAACGFMTAFIFQQFDRPHLHMFRDTSITGLIVGTVYGLLTVFPMEWILQPRESRDALPVGSGQENISGKSLS
jgi:hypothetical protein